MKIKGTIFDCGDERYNKVWENKKFFPHLHENFKKVCESLENLNIKRVVPLDFLGDKLEDIKCQELTLLVCPFLINVDEVNNTDLLQYNVLINDSVTIKKQEELLNYYPTKNLLIYRTNFFTTECMFDDFLYTVQSISPKSLSVKEIRNLILIETWKVNILNDLRDHDSDKLNLVNNIKNLERTYKRKLVELRNMKLQKEHLEKLRDSVGDKLNSEITKIRKNPFVKRLEIDDYIKFSFGQVYITTDVITGSKEGKDGISVPKLEKKKVRIGELIFVLKNSEVEIENEESIENYQHPHASNGILCYGEEKLKVEKYLSMLELNKLVNFLYSWAISYSPDTNPYLRIESFYEERKQEEQGGDEE